MSSEWTAHRLEDVVSLKTGKLDSNAAEEGGRYPFFTCSPITLNINTFAFDTEAVILAGNNANGVFATKHYNGKFNAYQRTYVIEPLDKKRTSCKYFYYVISDLVGHLKELSVGSATKFLTKTILNGLSVPLPAKKTQDLIAEFLSALDDRITLLRETNNTLETIAQVLFKSWFVDFDPVRAKAEGFEPEGLDAATAALFPESFEECELGLVPKGWSYVSLKEVTSIFDSQRVPLAGQERAKRKGNYPYYGAAALMDWVDGYLFDGIYLLSGEDGSVADPLGYPITQYVWGRLWVNNHAHVLQGKNGVSTEHLMLSLKQTNITPFITGAVQAKLSQSNMWRINFLMPSREIALAFGELLKPLYASLRHNTEQAQTLTQLRDTLLPRLISGQLRLPEAEVMVEEICA